MMYVIINAALLLGQTRLQSRKHRERKQSFLGWCALLRTRSGSEWVCVAVDSVPCVCRPCRRSRNRNSARPNANWSSWSAQDRTRRRRGKDLGTHRHP